MTPEIIQKIKPHSLEEMANANSLMRINVENGIQPVDKFLAYKHDRNLWYEELKDYVLPWRFFITNNASVERNRVIEVGMFDENIVGYGFEDYDLGIRLYKSGSKFIFDKNIINVHQEHPTNNNIAESRENINYICEKYNNIYPIF